MDIDTYRALVKSQTRTRKKPRQRESSLQASCVDWFRCQYRRRAGLLFAVPNGGSRNALEAVRLRREGVTAGVSDLLLLIPSGKYHGLCIEMKYGRNGQSEHQAEWQRLVEEQGYKYVVCRSLEEFQTRVTDYLALA